MTFAVERKGKRMIKRLIYAEDAEEAVIRHLQLDYDYAWGVREAINGLPSAQPECKQECMPMYADVSDCISRQDAIDVADAVWSVTGDKNVAKVWDQIKDLPSAQPQRIKGRWIHDGCDIPHGVDWMHCSVCGRREPHVPAAMTNYCPGCGADMRGEEDAAD